MLEIPGSAAAGREWFVANGLGGYAAGDLLGPPARRHHGLLIAALPPPLGRYAFASHVHERLLCEDGATLDLAETGSLASFRLEHGLPLWTHRAGACAIERRAFQPHEQNTTWLLYEAKAGAPLVLELTPWLGFRPHDEAMPADAFAGYAFDLTPDGLEVHGPQELPRLRIRFVGASAAFLAEPRAASFAYAIERERGGPERGWLWAPGRIRAHLAEADGFAIGISTESWPTLGARAPQQALRDEHERRGLLLAASGATGALDPVRDALVLAADAFVVRPPPRDATTARSGAAGDEPRTVIAGYPWFTDWGRDTMISLEGLALCTGRGREALSILRTFLSALRDGLIPNLFPEGEREGLYHTADATLWLFHAIDRAVAATGDRAFLGEALPRLLEIVERHRAGTRFGIGVDPRDGLLRQGAAGLPLTWMDARMGSWVVTPRRGKAVELNALWYHALRLLAGWCEQEQGPGARSRMLEKEAERVRRAFAERFWYEKGGHLYDVVDGEAGDDPSLRPNQIFALSLGHPVLEPSRWEPVLGAVRARLVTKMGLRTLAPDDPAYRPRYFGDLEARDGAYHQGTVWPWLAGPYVDAWLRVEPHARAEAHAWLAGLARHLEDACVGTMSEIFDAEPPHAPRGCFAQAWSVAELLRAWLRTSASEDAAGPAPSAAG
jgi:predicted glycogen debranching enzyme